MAKLTFEGGYTWSGEYEDTIFTPKGYKSDIRQGYDQKLFDYYVNKFDYKNAKRYVNMFSYANNPELENRRRALLVDIDRAEKQRAAVTKVVTNDEDMDAINFSSAIFNKEAYSVLNPTNRYKDKFDRRKDFVFERDNGGQKIEINFGKSESKILGLFTIDNDNSLKHFLKSSGYNETYLSNNGIRLGKDDNDNDIMTISYDSPITNEILYNIGRNNVASNDLEFKKWLFDRLSYRVLDKNDNEIEKRGDRSQINWIEPDIDLSVGIRAHDDQYLKELYEIIESSKSKEKAISEKAEDRTYSSLLYGYFNDRVAMAQQRLEVETNSEVRQALKSIVENQETTMMNQLGGGGLYNFQVFTNKYNKKGEAIMHEADTKNIGELTNIITAAISKHKLYVQLAEVNGMFGAYLTVPAYVDEKTGDVKNKAVNIFVKDFLAEEVKSRMEGDNTYLAVHEMDDIKAFDYEKDLSDGRSIGLEKTPDGEQWYVKDRDGNKQNKTQNEMLSLLKVAYGLDMGYNSYYNKYTNAKGEIINPKALVAELKQYAVEIVNNAYNNSEPIEEKDVFDEEEKKNKDEWKDEDNYDISWMKNDKLKEARNLYAKLLNRFNLNIVNK